MNSKIKLLILIGAIALFTEVFRLVNSARVNLDNKNLCVKQYKKFNKNQAIKFQDEEGKKMIDAAAYEACK